MTEPSLPTFTDWSIEVLSRLSDIGERVARIETTLDDRRPDTARIASLERTRSSVGGVVLAASAFSGIIGALLRDKLLPFFHFPT